MNAFLSVVGCSVADTNESDTHISEGNTKVLIQSVSWTENSAHRASTSNHDMFSFGPPMPKQAEQPIHCVDLNMAKILSEHRLHSCQCSELF